MERLIIFGSIYSFISKKNGETFYKVDYIDLRNGHCFSDYLTLTEYNGLKAKNLVTGNQYIGILSINDYGKAYVGDILES